MTQYFHFHWLCLNRVDFYGRFLYRFWLGGFYWFVSLRDFFLHLIWKLRFKSHKYHLNVFFLFFIKFPALVNLLCLIFIHLSILIRFNFISDPLTYQNNIVHAQISIFYEYLLIFHRFQQFHHTFSLILFFKRATSSSNKMQLLPDPPPMSNCDPSTIYIRCTLVVGFSNSNKIEK